MRQNKHISPEFDYQDLRRSEVGCHDPLFAKISSDNPNTPHES